MSKKTPILKQDEAINECAAEYLSWNLRLGREYFEDNLPLQVHIKYNDGKERKVPCSLKSKIDMEESYVVNYIPSEQCVVNLTFSEVFVKNPSKDDLYHLAKVTDEILGHLGQMMLEVGRRRSDYVCSPKCQD